MVQITGKFEMVKSENFVSHLKSMGVPADLAEGVDKIAPRLEFVQDGDKIKVTVQLDDPVSIELVLNQEVEEVFGDFKVKTTTFLEGDTLTQKSKYPSGKMETKIHKFTDSGLTVTYQDEDPATPDAVRTFRRL